MNRENSKETEANTYGEKPLTLDEVRTRAYELAQGERVKDSKNGSACIDWKAAEQALCADNVYDEVSVMPSGEFK